MGRCGLILIILMLFSQNAWAGSVDYIAHQLRRMADAEEKQALVLACEYELKVRQFTSESIVPPKCYNLVKEIINEQG